MGTIVVHTVSLLESLFTSLHSQEPHLHHHHHHSCGIHITVGESDTWVLKASKNMPGFLLKELCGVVMCDWAVMCMFVPANHFF
jgi:hypothetical protein